MNKPKCTDFCGKQKVVDGIMKNGRIHKKFDKTYMNMISKNCKICQIRERVYINKFGVPVVFHRISGGDVYLFAKIMGLSLLTNEQTHELERMLTSSACTFAGENVIYKKESDGFC